jgi:1-acyl-sn-glycerol-3-phosphate acyltransferase
MSLTDMFLTGMFLTGSVIYWIFFIITMILMFFPALLIWLLTLPFDRNKRILHQYSCFWGSLYTWLNPFWRVKIQGREKIKRGVSYVYCANHQSVMDILIIYRLFLHFKWVSKKENFKVPFFGWNMHLNNYLYLDRSSRSSKIRMMVNGEKLLNQGSSIMIFPEGTRSKDGSIGKFREGAFILAQKTASPVVPVVIRGSGDVFTDGTILFRKFNSMTIKLLDPVAANLEENPKALGSSVRRKFLEELGQTDEQD